VAKSELFVIEVLLNQNIQTLNQTGKVCINVTVRRVLATIVAVENNNYYVF
jgi:hypothetical protein